MECNSITPPVFGGSDMQDVRAALHVSEVGVTLYANRAMLKLLGERLLALAESPAEEFYETHFPSEFYSDIGMFDSAATRTVEIVLSHPIADLFKAAPDFVDEDGAVLRPEYCLTVMHHSDPLGTIPREEGDQVSRATPSGLCDN